MATPIMATVTDAHVILETPRPLKPTRIGTRTTVRALRNEHLDASVVISPIPCVKYLF